VSRSAESIIYGQAPPLRRAPAPQVRGTLLGLVRIPTDDPYVIVLGDKRCSVHLPQRRILSELVDADGGEVSQERLLECAFAGTSASLKLVYKAIEGLKELFEKAVPELGLKIRCRLVAGPADIYYRLAIERG
jgi:hypothetical protein